MLHDGDMRRSDEELGELMRSGTSAALWSDILDRGRQTEQTSGVVGRQVTMCFRVVGVEVGVQ